MPQPARFLRKIIIYSVIYSIATSACIFSADTPATDPLPPPSSVCVGKLDIILPEKESDAENILSEKLFNRPEEKQFSNITSNNWKEKWQQYTNALVENAKKGGFDYTSLKTCLAALNQGRNRQTMLCPMPPSLIDIPGTTEAEVKAQAEKNKAAEAAYKLALAERDKNPEDWYNNHLAIVPVGAYLARHSKGECWIILCNWEYASENSKDARALGHIMIWAMDTKTAAVVAYVTCD